MSDITIRAEADSDHERVEQIHELAFGGSAEAGLVRSLRRSVRPQVSLVAELRGELVGHVFFSPVSVEGSRFSFAAGALAPLAVVPEVQRRGVGSALVREGLKACVPLGWSAVFLVGDPPYYARFGFVLAAPLGFRYESDAFDSVFQVRELIAGSLSGHGGWVRYAPAFSEL